MQELLKNYPQRLNYTMYVQIFLNSILYRKVPRAVWMLEHRRIQCCCFNTFRHLTKNFPTNRAASCRGC